MTIFTLNLRLFTCLTVVVFLMGCAHFPLTSIYKLRNFDPITTDFEQLRIAVRVPDNMDIPSDGVRMIFNAENAKPTPWTEEFYFERTTDRHSLKQFEQRGAQVHAFRIASSDFERFRRARERVKIEIDEDRDGSMKIVADACYTTAKMPPRLPVSTFVNASETNGYVPILVNADMLKNPEKRLPEKCDE